MSSTQLYFILVLVQLTLLSPFLVRTIQENKYTKILFLITPIYLLFVYGYVFLFGKQFVLTQTFFPAWLIFYYYGLWVKIKGNPHLLRRKIALKYTLFLVIALGISILESQLIKNNGYPIGFAASQIKFSSFIYAFMVINLIFIGRDIDINKEFKALRVLGDESYGIYYVHMIWIYIISKAIDSIPIPMVFNILPLYQIIQAGLTLLFSYFSIQITKVLLGKRIANKAVGF
jgi:peptidoglycan/LPS O-acetylase OafA/YrhL